MIGEHLQHLLRVEPASALRVRLHPFVSRQARFDAHRSESVRLVALPRALHAQLDRARRDALRAEVAPRTLQLVQARLLPTERV